jgi:L-fuculose-phosphate aldolase
MRPIDRARAEEEAAARRDLLEALVIAEREGVIDFNGHASVRLWDGRILINTAGSVRSALTADDIMVMDAAGEGLGGATPPMERFIHTAIYRARRDVGAVIHGHPKWSTVLTSSGVPLQPVFAQGCLVAGLPLLDDPLSINTAPRGDIVAGALGEARGVLLRSHGTVIVAPDIVEALVLAIYLEMNAERQAEAMKLGTPYVFSEVEAAACEATLYKRALMRKAWDYFRAKGR